MKHRTTYGIYEKVIEAGFTELIPRMGLEELETEINELIIFDGSPHRALELLNVLYFELHVISQNDFNHFLGSISTQLAGNDQAMLDKQGKKPKKHKKPASFPQGTTGISEPMRASSINRMQLTVGQQQSLNDIVIDINAMLRPAWQHNEFTRTYTFKQEGYELAAYVKSIFSSSGWAVTCTDFDPEGEWGTPAVKLRFDRPAHPVSDSD